MLSLCHKIMWTSKTNVKADLHENIVELAAAET